MSSIRQRSRLLLVAVCCVALGAGVSAIASAGATTSGTTHAAKAAHRKVKAGALRRFADRAVQGDVVVRTKTGFATVTFDRGTVDSVSGQQLTITEGTKKATYKTVTLTVPTTAKVRDNGTTSSLSDLKSGQRVLVLTAPKRTFVIARTPRTA